MTAIPTWLFTSREQPGVKTKWEIASGHPKGWRVTRYKDGYGFTLQEYETRSGRLRLYKTPESARKAADQLNAIGYDQA